MLLSQRVFSILSILAIFPFASTAKAQLIPSDFETPEYYRSGGLQYINAAEAYALGFTGEGIKIGIADEAMQWSHPELNQRVYWPSPLYQFPAPGYSTFPDHGTHVAGIAAAERNNIGIMGVAFDASVASAVALAGGGFTANSAWAQSLINAGVSVVNGSFAYDARPAAGPQVGFQFFNGYSMLDAYNSSSRMSDAGILMVFSNGNNYEEQPVASSQPAGYGVLPLITPANTRAGYPLTDPTATTTAIYRLFNNSALPQDISTWVGNQIPEEDALRYDFSDLKGSMITVSAVDFDQNGVASIASFSNRCGLAADWCIAAPGVGVYSTVPMDTYGDMSGTSMSAPFVAGVAALVRQAFPYMTARQSIEVILTTSDPIAGLTASDVGHGLVNAGRAVRGPVEFGHPSLIPGNDSIFNPIFAVDTQGYDSVWSNNISGIGGFSKAGKGTLLLTGTNTYTGDTTVSGGLLRIDGSIVHSNLTVESGGALSGIGQLGSTTISPGGVMAPGNSIGEQAIVGNLSLNSGAQLQIEVQGPQNDKVSVTGATTLDGEVIILPYQGGSPFPYFDYQIINSGSSVNYGGSINQDAVTSTLLSYGANLVVGSDGDPTTFDIAWLPKNGVGVVGSALNRLGNNESNQQSTAGVLDNSFKSLAVAAGNTTGTSGKNATGEAIGNTGFTSGQAAAAGYSSDYIQLLDDIVQLSLPAQLAAAINSLSPEPYAAFQAVGLNSLKQQRELLATHAGSCQDTGWVVSIPNTESSVPGKTGAKLPICVFADAVKSNSSINGSEGLSSYLSNSNVAFWGLEYLPSKQWTVGAAYGYGSSNLYGMSLASAGVSSTNNSGAIYGIYKPFERLKLQAAFGYTGFSVEGTRTVAFIGNGQPINGNTSANGYTTSLDAKYDIPINTGSKRDWLIVSPIAGIAWGAYQQQGFNETGGGATDLQVNGHTSNSLVGTIGFELSTTPIKFTKSGKQSFAPKLALAYQVDALANANYTKELTASFVEAPAAGVITTQGQNGGANAFTIAAGGDLQLFENTSLYATIRYEVENSGSQFGYSGGVRYLF